MTIKKYLTVKNIILYSFLLAVLLFNPFSYKVGSFWGIYPNREMYHRTATYYAITTMRELAVLIESDRERHKEYLPYHPYWGPLSEDMIRKLGGNPHVFIDPYHRDGKSNVWRTGPIADEDRGARIKIKGTDYQYFYDGKDFWALISRGPDGGLDLTSSTLEKVKGLKINPYDSGPLASYTYDVTNGTISDGDIWRLREP